MAVTKTGSAYDGVRGARQEFGTFTLTASTIAADAEAQLTFALEGAKTGDLVFINSRQLDAGLVAKEARVSAEGVLEVTVRNSSTGSVTGEEKTYDYLIFKAE